MVALFLEDISRYDEYIDQSLLSSKELTVYLFTPPVNQQGQTPAAEIVFGRKLHRAVALQ